jgi:hypothetical protein
MTAVPLPPLADRDHRFADLPRLPGGLRYARARLLLGIAGVGAAVLLAAAALALGLPGRLMTADPAQPIAAAVAQVLAALLAPTLLLAPLDVLGGTVVRGRVPLGTWGGRWLRGVTVQFAVWGAAAAVLLAAGRAGAALGGRTGAAAAAVAAFAVVQGVLLVGRPRLARLVAPLRVRAVGEAAPADAAWLADATRAAGLDPARVRLVDAPDPGFTGGWIGVRAPVLWVPAHWHALPREVLVAQLARQRAVAGLGLHRRGVLGALVWNAAGLAAVLAVVPAADPTTAAGLVAMVAGMTLWAFAGALVLPTPSRAAVYVADAAAARQVGAGQVRAAVVALDRWQDDEAERRPVVEAVFHPVPARGRRVRRLTELERPGSDADADPALPLHQIARHAQFLAWGALSPLARAVHCNVGRPSLWVMWPGD